MSCNYFTLLLTGSHSSRSNSWRATSWRHDDEDHDDGDHGVMSVTMVIMTVLRRWRSQAQDDDGHIMSHILIVMFIFYASYFA